MVYHFFSKWKQIESDVFSVKQEIIQAEKVYKLKIRLLKKIWSGLNKQVIDSTSVQRLLKIYLDKKNNALYELMWNKIRDISSIGLMHREEISQFSDLIYYLKEKIKEEKRIALNLLGQLRIGRIPVKVEFYKLQELLKSESLFLKIGDKKFKKIEDFFLLKKEPGAESTGYVQVIKAIEKGIVKEHGNKLWVGDKPIQGLKISYNKIIIKGDHYGPLQNAKWIGGDRFVSPSMQDPYSYFVERGKLHNYGRQQIQKVLGISNAEAVVSLEIEIFPEQLCIKIVKGLPTHFAITQLSPVQVRKVIKEAALVAA